MSVKLAQLPGPALLAHLALGPCHSTHQQGQVTQDLPSLGLVLGEQTVIPRVSLLPVPTLGLDGVLYPPCATRYAPSILFSISGACANPRFLLQSCWHTSASTLLPAPLTNLDFHCWKVKSTKGSTAGQLSTGRAWHWLW